MPISTSGAGTEYWSNTGNGVAREVKDVFNQSVEPAQSVEPTMAWAYSVPVAIGRTCRRLGLPLLRLAAAVTLLWFLLAGRRPGARHRHWLASRSPLLLQLPVP